MMPSFFTALFMCLSLLAAPAAAQEQPYGQWLAEFKQEARQAGILQKTLDSAFIEAEPDESIIELDRKQPEKTITLAEYLRRGHTPARIRDGQQFYAENAALLERIGRAYGVQPRFIVALWGVETNFGRYTGNFITTDALATLAYEGRRAEFFRNELLEALRILESEHMRADEMYGSWAGALGQCQFMPSTYLKHAVDYDRDGKRDIWDTKADVFASIANYLQSLHWKGDETWGRPVTLPKGFDMRLADITKTRPISEWQAMGVRNSDGSDLPKADMEASLITIGDGGDAPTYIVYSNFKALLQWNRSRYFATAVGMLADAIAP